METDREVIARFKEWRKQEGLPFNPHWVPNEFNSIKDLEDDYATAEQKAIAFERERDQKAKASSDPPPLPAARPRKAPAYVTQKTLNLTMEGAGKAIRDFVAPLVKRVAELEARPELTFGGPWKDGQSYPEKCLCQHQGGLWLSKMPNNTTRPGSEPPAWRLVVKRGAAG